MATKCTVKCPWAQNKGSCYRKYQPYTDAGKCPGGQHHGAITQILLNPVMFQKFPAKEPHQSEQDRNKDQATNNTYKSIEHRSGTLQVR